MTDVEKVREQWDRVPHLECKGACYDYCGHVLASPAENEVLKWYATATGMEYHPFETDRANSAASLIDLMGHPVWCPYLKDRKCSIYSVRPAICRVWGNAESLKCFMGCRPKAKLLTDEECTDIFQKLEDLK